MNDLDPRRGLTAIRSIKSLIVGKSVTGGEAYAAGQGWRDTPGVIPNIRAAAVGAANSTDDAALIGVNGSDLLPLIRSREIISRLAGIRRVPFDTRLTAQTGWLAAAWVGEGQPAPVSRQSYATASTLPRRKLVSIAVIDEELARSSSPSAEISIGRDMIASCVAGSDVSFIDPSNGGDTATPASVTYGAPSFGIAGSSVANLDAGLGELQSTLVDSGSTLEFAAYIVHPNTLGSIALMRDASGTLAYPQVNVRTGGFIGGIPVIPSASVPRIGSPISTSIILLDGSRIWLADDGELRFVTSNVTSLQMLDNPTNDSVVPTATSMVSMMQTSSVACKGTRVLNFAAAAGAAAVLSGVGF